VITVSTGETVSYPIPPIIAGEPPTQPWGRSPLPRGTREPSKTVA
jgi:hypothetical protein